MQKAEFEPIFESGKIILAAGKLRLLQVNLAAKSIDVSIEDKELVKRALQLRSVFAPSRPVTEEKESKKKKVASPLQTLRFVAETLCSKGITITIMYKGDRIITLGANAKPTLLQYVTGTRGVAINSILRLAQMVA